MAAGVIIGDLTTLVDGFLGGEVNLRSARTAKSPRRLYPPWPSACLQELVVKISNS
ncbi:hypothetical protein ACFLSF_01800 [Candidatus Bipolaricaulota bacterium]